MSEQNARARVEYDVDRGGVKIAVSPWGDRDGHAVVIWPSWPETRRITPDQGLSVEDEAASWLRLDADVARAIYEGLAAYFGGVGTDVRALRKDYDAERERVDRLIAHLTRGA